MILKWQAVGGHGVFPVKGTQKPDWDFKKVPDVRKSMC